MTSRPKIPAEIARLLRVEARFGCCRCGSPIFEYHHIVEWSEDQHFRLEDMMILCPNCHHAAGHGGLNVAEQRKYKARPHNQRRGYASGLLSLEGDVPVVNLGGNILVNDGTLLAFGDEPALGLSLGEAGQLELSLVLLDEQDRTLAIVEKNEWISGDPSIWDLEAGYRRLRLRQRKGKVALDIDARRSPVTIRAHLWSRGRQIFIGPSALGFGGKRASVRFVNMTFSAMHFSLNGFVEADVGGPSIDLKPVPDERLGTGRLFSGTDPAVVAQAIEDWREKKQRSLGPPHPSDG